MAHHVRVRSNEGDALAPPSRTVKSGRSYSNASATGSSRPPGSFAPSVGPPGSFNTQIIGTSHRPEFGKQDYFNFAEQAVRNDQTYEERKAASEQRQAEVRDQLDREIKIKAGSENLLEALQFKKNAKEQRARVETELDTTSRKIEQLKSDLAAEVEKSQPGNAGRLSQLFQPTTRAPSRQTLSPDAVELNPDSESPTFALSEALQALEAPGLPPNYYVDHANKLVDLLRRHPRLKYDLVWSIFGLRVQVMLLSGSREIAAAGFRMLRYAMTSRKSLSIMRSFNTDFMVMLALIRDSKDSVEREQALKFVRAFLDVKDGIEELPRSIVRVMVAIAEQHDDKLRNICILTLSEILIRKPSLVVEAGGIGPLSDAMSEGIYHPSESLGAAFMYLLDTPGRRKYLRSGFELQGPFAAISDATSHMSEDRLKTNAKVVASLLKSWPGLIALSSNNFIAVRSLTTALYIQSTRTRDLVLEIVLDVLRIKPPSWSASFLAGRRLTTYGRFMNLKGPASSIETEEEAPDGELVSHFRALLLAVFVHAGLLDAIVFTLQQEQEQTVKRKAALLMGETLELVNDTLPASWTQELQVLPGLFDSAAALGVENRFVASSLIYQIDSVNRTLYRTGRKNRLQALEMASTISQGSVRRPSDLQKDILTPQIEEHVFRAVLLETQVIITPNWTKWRWELIQKVIEGPLLNPKRLEEAIKASKFMKRLIGFYRPFKYRFADIRNNKPNQRYVKAGCALMKTLLSSPEGVKYLAENKLLRQLAECLAQVDRMSGITSASPLFAADRVADTLSHGYFSLLGAISSTRKGLAIIEHWHMMNMLYHIVELQDRDDLVMLLLGNMDYSLDSHLRIILSKSMTAGSKQVRTFSTRILRKYATGRANGAATHDAPTTAAKATSTETQATKTPISERYWSIDMLVTQLYDPDIEVCEVAIKILEEACNDVQSLQYVVYCRPALDHLGEIAAPLLLRFLSTSVGYHYLDELDYISQEMDDWFLGRNDSYVRVVEASVARTTSRMSQDKSNGLVDDGPEEAATVPVPPHFYRELTRTAEGCDLLEAKGHFNEFVSVITRWGMENEDQEKMLKVKGALWAIGNVGSMELGAPFLGRCDAVERIIGIAEQSEVMSLRGTAFFALGLISRSVDGQELLAENGWDVAVNEEGESMGVCLPRDLGKLFSVPSWVQRATTTPHPGESETPAKELLEDGDALNMRVLKVVNDLGNTVLAKARAGELHSLKAKNAPGFSSPAFFLKVMALLERHHIRLPVLRFVIDLFDYAVLRQIVLDESESSGDEGDDQGQGNQDSSEDDEEDMDETMRA